MEVESEDENSRKDEFLRTKPFNRNATKRTIIPPMKISKQDLMQVNKQQRKQGSLRAATWSGRTLSSSKATLFA